MHINAAYTLYFQLLQMLM